MIDIFYDLVRDRPGAVPGDQVRARNDNTVSLESSIGDIPNSLLVAFHTQLGMLQGCLERLKRIYFTGNVKIVQGHSSIDGSINVHWERDGVLVHEMAEQIAGIAYTLAHGYLGTYKVVITFSQTCVLKDAA